MLRYAELKPNHLSMSLVALNAYDNAPFGGKLFKASLYNNYVHSLVELRSVVFLCCLLPRPRCLPPVRAASPPPCLPGHGW